MTTNIVLRKQYLIMIEKTPVNREVHSIDVPTMETLSADEYREFLENGGLFRIDELQILRSSCADYPIATSKKQFDIFISHLITMRQNLL